MTGETLDPFEAAVLDDCREKNLFPEGGGVVVAVSGGPDSTALLAALDRLSSRLNIQLTAAHLHHGVRGKSADGDAYFCRELAGELGLPFHLRRLGHGELKRSGGPGLQAAARRARYEFLEEVRRQSGAVRIATGHTADDQAETLVLALLRGAGLTGLGGIAPRRGRLVRPLLGLGRREVLEYLARRGRAYRTDPSNRSRKYLRNRVRLDLLPLLYADHPGLRDSLVALAGELGELREEVWEIGFRKHEQLARDEGAGVSFGARELAALHPLVRGETLRLAYAGLGAPVHRLTRSHYEAIDRLLWPERLAGRADLPGRAAARREKERLLLYIRSPEKKTPEAYCLSLSVPGEVRTPQGAIITAEETALPENPAAEGPFTYYLDPDRLEGPLAVRSPRPGDRIELLGAEGSKKAGDVFTDAKTPRNERPGWPLVVCGDRPAWLAGLAASRRFALTRESSRAVRLRATGGALRLPE